MNQKQQDMREMPPAMILCGGKGTRIRDVSEIIPKPMVPIGEQPILWHIMRSYAAFGVKRFILCLGYKKEEIIDYFLNFHARATDMTLQLGDLCKVVYHNQYKEADWSVTLAHTGLETKTAGRVWKAGSYLQDSDDDFFLTYGDGVSDVNIADLLEFHRRENRDITVTAVHPEGRFGEIKTENGKVEEFAEKKARTEGVINGGFMVLKRAFLKKYLNAEIDDFLEQEPMRRAVEEGEMSAFLHEGFWQCMDTLREYQFLNELWSAGKAPWTKYW